MILIESQRSGQPWFLRRPRLALKVAVGLYLGIFVLRQVVAGADEVITSLYVLPISLVALTFGRRAGVTAGIVAVVLLCAWVLVGSVELSVVGWISRIVPLLLVGPLLGDAADRLARAAEERRQLEIAELRHRQAVEINDTLVQGMSVAKWSFEAGLVDAGIEGLTQTIRIGHDLVSQLIKDAEMGDRVWARQSWAGIVPLVRTSVRSTDEQDHRV